MGRKLMNGNQAAALAVIFPGSGGLAYPITPDLFSGKYCADVGRGEFPRNMSGGIRIFGAILFNQGPYQGPTLTATSCQGLAYMHELLHWLPGPFAIVLVNVNRAWCTLEFGTGSVGQSFPRDTGGYNFTVLMQGNYGYIDLFFSAGGANSDSLYGGL